MLHFLLVSLVTVAAATPSYRRDDYRREDKEHHTEPAHPDEDHHHLSHKMVHLRYGGPTGIIRFIDPHNKHDKKHHYILDIEGQNRIISKVYIPEFIQPVWVWQEPTKHSPEYQKKYEIEEDNPEFGNRHVHEESDRHREHGHKMKKIQNDNHKHHDDDQQDEHIAVKELNRLRGMVTKIFQKHRDKPHHQTHKYAHKQHDNDYEHRHLTKHKDDHHVPEHLSHHQELKHHQSPDSSHHVQHDNHHKGYDRGWAPLPDVTFIGRNH